MATSSRLDDELIHRLWRHFAYADARGDDSRDFFARLAAEAPVVRFDRFWIVSSYEDVVAVGRDESIVMPPPDFPADRRAANPEFTDFFCRSLSVTSPETHRRLRGVLNRMFSARSVARLQRAIEQIVADLMDGPLRTGRCELVSEIAVPLPFRVTCAFLGIPEADWETVQSWAQGMSAYVADSFPGISGHESTPLSRVDFQSLQCYVGQLLVDRERTPQDDLVSALAEAHMAGRVTSQEVVDLVTLLFMTGTDTVTCALTNAVFCLAEQRDVWRRLVADPAITGAAFAESIRLLTPVPFASRMVTRDVRVRELELQHGDRVLLCYAGANLDARVIPEPLTFRLDRSTTANVSFGHGVYHCLGAALATMSCEAVLRRLAEHAPDFEITAQPTWRQEISFASPAHLHIALPAARATGQSALVLTGVGR